MPLIFGELGLRLAGLLCIKKHRRRTNGEKPDDQAVHQTGLSPGCQHVVTLTHSGVARRMHEPTTPVSAIFPDRGGSRHIRSEDLVLTVSLRPIQEVSP